MIQCIIFDCDGTLVDSEYLFNRALSEKLNERSIVLSADELVKLFRGVKFATMLDTLESEYSIELDANFILEYRQLVELYFKQELIACDGVRETLAEINRPMCVASNGPLAKMKIALEVTKLSSFFDGHLFSAYDVGTWKPDPGLFLHAAKTMGFNPQDCLIVEDSSVGIQAAKAAGINVILYDPHRIHSPQDEVGLIHHFEDVLKSLN